MSLLAPLYFLGALAVGLPILFHLIRRQPKGQVEFSSLMFLRPTPPRLTRRSRLDNWLLLLLRALALMLLAAAFARPFLRSVAVSDQELPGRRIVLMVDTSASMQRAPGCGSRRSTRHRTCWPIYNQPTRSPWSPSIRSRGSPLASIRRIG